jgi:hypothetical protein
MSKIFKIQSLMSLVVRTQSPTIILKRERVDLSIQAKEPQRHLLTASVAIEASGLPMFPSSMSDISLIFVDLLLS